MPTDKWGNIKQKKNILKQNASLEEQLHFFSPAKSWLRTLFCLNPRLKWAANKDSMVPTGGSSTPLALENGLALLA